MPLFTDLHSFQRSVYQVAEFYAGSFYVYFAAEKSLTLYSLYDTFIPNKCVFHLHFPPFSGPGVTTRTHQPTPTARPMPRHRPTITSRASYISQTHLTSNLTTSPHNINASHLNTITLHQSNHGPPLRGPIKAHLQATPPLPPLPSQTNTHSRTLRVRSIINSGRAVYALAAFKIRPSPYVADSTVPQMVSGSTAEWWCEPSGGLCVEYGGVT